MRLPGLPVAGDGYQDGLSLYAILRADPVSDAVDPSGQAIGALKYSCNCFCGVAWGTCSCNVPFIPKGAVEGAMFPFMAACCMGSCFAGGLGGNNAQIVGMKACIQSALENLPVFTGVVCVCT